MTMREGERQVSPTIDGIRADHVNRYKWAAKKIDDLCPGRVMFYTEDSDKERYRSAPEGEKRTTPLRVIDFACGIGYGSKVMSDVGHEVTGFDVDQEAIDYAFGHYWREGMKFIQANGNAPGELGDYDAAVCFETIEHIEDPRPLLKALRESSPMLIASVPNEAVFPFSPAEGITTAFHFRHYLKIEFEALLRECGWCPVDWYGQEGNESEVEPDVNGRTLIVVAQRDVLPDEQPVGKRVAILGLGPSISQYLDITKRQGGRSKLYDEVWTINALGDVFACDLVFHMDDVRIQEIRAAANPTGNIAAMIPWLKNSRVPVVTSRRHPDYPALVEFPLEDVLNHFGHEYFNNTAAYAIAFAIHIGVAQISLFGMDFTYPNRHDAEKGRACVEYWLGQARARGIRLLMPRESTLMDAYAGRASRLYGYDTVDVKFNLQPDGSVKLDFVPKESLPSADEIEASYDHSAPIAEQHLKKEAT
jgi:SAM-dependent methyltransferase